MGVIDIVKNEIRNNIGLRIYDLIKEHDDKVEDLAEDIHVSRSHLYKILSGYYDVSFDYIEFFSKRYNVDPIYLILGRNIIISTDTLEAESFDDRFREDLNYITKLPRSEQDRYLANMMHTFWELYSKQD